MNGRHWTKTLALLVAALAFPLCNCYALAIRHVGFRQFTDTIEVVAGQRLERELVMTEQAQELDSVRVSARRNDERNVGGVVVASAPGVMRISAAGYTYLASSRKGGDASLSLQYSNRGSDCGTLLLWTRER